MNQTTTQQLTHHKSYHDAGRIELATMDEWRQLSKKYPEFRKESHAMLKDFGYMKLIDLIETQKPKRLLEFGHGFNSTLLARFQNTSETFGIDDHQSLPYFPPKEQWDALYGDLIRTPCPNAHLVRGLLGRGDTLGLDNASFDMIVSVSVLEELQPDELSNVIADCVDLLAPGGIFAGTFDVQLKHIERINPLLNAFKTHGMTIEKNAIQCPSPDFNSLLVESPSVVMLTYQMAENENRTFNGHWSSVWFMVRKPGS